MDSFKNILKKIDHGDHVTTPELDAIISELTIAESSLRKLNNPKYSLVLNDIFYNLKRCEEWKLNRERKVQK